jgi:hypothetical protein
MAAPYLVTPDKGRVGKARNVEPFQVEAGEHAGDLDRVMNQVALNIGKIAKRRKCFATYELPEGESFTYKITVWCGDDVVATCIVEALEESDE